MSPRHPINGGVDALIGFPWSGIATVPHFVEFDAAAFAQRVLTKMGRRTFREVAPEIGISHATLNRVSRGKAPDVQTYLRISAWVDGASDLTAQLYKVREALRIEAEQCARIADAALKRNAYKGENPYLYACYRARRADARRIAKEIRARACLPATSGDVG